MSVKVPLAKAMDTGRQCESGGGQEMPQIRTSVGAAVSGWGCWETSGSRCVTQMLVTM